MKICSKCKELKTFDCFTNSKSRKDGFESYCKECNKKRCKAYRLSNPDKVSEYHKQYYLKNADGVKEKVRKYRLSNVDRVRETSRQYCHNNLDKRRNRENARRAKKLSNGVYEISKKEIKKIYSSPCFYCGSFNLIQADHVIPIIKGGRHSIGNLVPACAKCNRSKGTKLLIEWRVWKSNLK
jgi:5-methylcytosine-specific restriction endonuclease McrA